MLPAQSKEELPRHRAASGPGARAVARGARRASLARARESLGPTLERRHEGGACSRPALEESGRYEVRGELGAGGQSVVLRAWDERLGREVAIKELRTATSAAARERFLREARITARLEHPNIVPVYEIGRRGDDSLYCVQRLVAFDASGRGTRTLRQALEQAATVEERLRLLPHLVAVCQGVAYAHAQGVLHRDLKPENVVLGRFGETMVLDWGLARAEADDGATPVLAGAAPRVTIAGHAYGTPCYMSPEQARGETVGLDARTDVWSLGAMLFELLTGRPPFLGESALEVVEQVKAAPVPDARALEPLAPPELAAVARRALARAPEERFPSVEAFVDEIAAWQNGRRLSTYSYSAFELARLFASRHRAATAVAMLALVALAGLGTLVLARSVEARRAVARALTERARAADRALDWNSAALLYAAARANDDTPETRWGVQVSGSRLKPPPARVGEHPRGVKHLAWSKDGRHLATAGADGAVRVFRADGALEFQLEAHAGEATGVAWSGDGALLATCGADGRAWLWDVATRRRLQSLAHRAAPVNRVALSADGRLAVLALEEGAVLVRDLQRAADLELLRLGPEQHPVYAVALDPLGGHFAAVTWDGALELRGLDGRLVRRLGKLAPTLLDVQYSPDGASLAVASSDRAVRVFPVGAERDVQPEGARTLEGHAQKVYAVAFSPDGKLLASASTDRSVRLWHTRLGLGLVGLSVGGTLEGSSVAFSPDGRRLALGGAARHVELHALPDASSSFDAEQWAGRIESLQWAPEADALVVEDQGAVLWMDPRRGRTRVLHPTIGLVSRGLALSRDGSTLAWPCEPGAVCLASADGLADTTRHVYPLGEGQTGAFANQVHAVTVAPGARWMAAADRRGEVRLWNFETGSLGLALDGHRAAVFTLDASPDGALLASGSYDQTVRLWDARTGQPRAALDGHTHGVRRVRFSPDGRTLASASWDRTVRLWDVATGAQRAVCQGHEDHVLALDWSPDGRWLASGGRDGTVRIWDGADCKELARLVTDEPHVYSLAVWGDGQGLTYAGRVTHPVAFSPLGNARAQRAGLERALGLRVEGIDLVPAG